MSGIEDLYSEEILTLVKEPFQFKKMENASVQFTAYNPICGDKFTFYLLINQNIVQDASFYGFGCALSKASSSVLTSIILGKTISEIEVLVKEFLLGISMGELSKDYQLFSPVKNFPERIDCVKLGWAETETQIKTGNLFQ